MAKSPVVPCTIKVNKRTAPHEATLTQLGYDVAKKVGEKDVMFFHIDVTDVELASQDAPLDISTMEAVKAAVKPVVARKAGIGYSCWVKLPNGAVQKIKAISWASERS